MQYGLNAFNAGLIDADQFVELNERIGGYDADGRFVAQRTLADPGALRIAYESGRVQLIDLDAARGRGDNTALATTICARLPCRIGGGIRSIDRAQATLAAGAHAVIVSSALFRAGRVDLAFATELADAIGPECVIAAVDSRGGRVAIHGWKTMPPITAVEAVGALEPYCSEFLYTHVDKEGLMPVDLPAEHHTTRSCSGPGHPVAIVWPNSMDRIDLSGIVEAGSKSASASSRSTSLRASATDSFTDWPRPAWNNGRFSVAGSRE